MTQIRLIALDMDGTLLDDDHATVPARNVAALRRAAERGAAVAIASGRAWDLLHEVAAQLDMLHYAVLSNGAAVLDVTSGEWLWRKGLPRAQSRRLIELLLARDVPFEVYADGENYIQADRSGRVLARALSPEFASVLRRYSRFPEDLNAALEGRCVEKIHIFHVPPEERAALQAALEATGPLAVTGSFGTNMELTARGVNKAAAVQALCRRLEVTAEQVMAFGDADNDLELLRWARWSFAMENGAASAKAAARYVTGANRAGGVGMAVERYLAAP